MSAKKFDKGKTRWDLLPWREIEEIVEVLTYGAAKYGANNWKRGLDWDRLFSAAIRHLQAAKRGETADSESGKPPLAHAMCNLLFMMYFDKERMQRQTKEGTTLLEIFEGENNAEVSPPPQL